MARGRRHSDPQREKLLSHQPVSPDQSSECKRKDFFLVCWPKGSKYPCKETTSLTFQHRKPRYMASKDVWSISSGTSYKWPRKNRRICMWFSWILPMLSDRSPHKFLWTALNFFMSSRRSQSCSRPILGIHSSESQHRTVPPTAPSGNRHHGRLHYLPSGIHNGN